MIKRKRYFRKAGTAVLLSMSMVISSLAGTTGLADAKELTEQVQENDSVDESDVVDGDFCDEEAGGSGVDDSEAVEDSSGEGEVDTGNSDSGADDSEAVGDSSGEGEVDTGNSDSDVDDSEAVDDGHSEEDSNVADGEQQWNGSDAVDDEAGTGGAEIDSSGTAGNASAGSVEAEPMLEVIRLYDAGEVLLEEGEIESRMNFSSSTDPAKVMKNAFGGNASGWDKGDNIEGPARNTTGGNNCYVASASNWSDNGNLAVVDLAKGNTDTADGADLDEGADSYDGAAENASGILDDTHVFRYFLHDQKDFDRNTSITDRQRIEIKTDTSNPDINCTNGEILTNRWKFFLPEDTPLPPDKDYFFHIFQTKATQGDESSMPVFTFTVANDALVFEGSNCGHVNQDIQDIAEVDIDQVLGQWMDAEVTLYTAEKGYVYVKLVNTESGEILMEEGYEIDNWRRPERLEEDGLYHEYNRPAAAAQTTRSKWGLYREIFEENFGAATMYLGDLQIIKRNPDTYVFKDADGNELYDPREQEREVTWVVDQNEIEVLEGTDFSNIYLPSQVEVYVEGHEKTKLPVVWEKGVYDQAVRGIYTVYGTLVTDGEAVELDGSEDESADQILEETSLRPVTNPQDVKAELSIKVTDRIAGKKVNWALGTAKGGTASVKTISGSGSNPAENLIDGTTDHTWKTNSGLISVGEEDNGGYRYWAAIDLGTERSFDEVDYELGSIGSSKQFRLKNYTIFYGNEAEAYEELIPCITGNPRTNGATPDPLTTEHGSSWIEIPGTHRENDIANGIKVVTNNQRYTFQMEEALEARYVLVWGEIENVDATAGSIETKVIQVMGEKAWAEIPCIRSVKNPELLTVTVGKDAAELSLPDTVEVELSDGTRQNALVSWNLGSYHKDTEGVCILSGELDFPDDHMQNPERLRASMTVLVQKKAETVNWAAASQGTTVKVVNWNTTNPGDFLLDEKTDTLWKTNSKLVTAALMDGYCYWAALDLGQTRDVEKIQMQWETTSGRLKGYSLYYAADTETSTEAWNALKGSAGGTINESTATPDPLTVSDIWTKIEGAESEGTVTKNAVITDTLEEPVSGRYLLLRCNITQGVSAGAINMAEFSAYGSTNSAGGEKTAITAVWDLSPIQIRYATPFGELQLPQTVMVSLENHAEGQTEAEVPVVWEPGSYSSASEGTVFITGNLVMLPGLDNPENRKAQLMLQIQGSQIARKADVVFMLNETEIFHTWHDVIVGSKLTSPVNLPERDGYGVTGWYRDAAGMTEWNMEHDRLTSGGAVLYAKWEKLPDKPQEPDQPESPDDSDNPDIPDNPDTPDSPNIPENPDTPDSPDIPENPDTPISPDLSDTSRDSRDDASDQSITTRSDQADYMVTADGRSESGQWKRDDRGWWFAFDRGAYPGGSWNMITWNGVISWYYFDENGYMATGWHQDPDGNRYYLELAHNGTQGAMCTGWVQIEGIWYYFYPTAGAPMGAMARSVVIDGCELNEVGRIQEYEVRKD